MTGVFVDSGGFFAFLVDVSVIRSHADKTYSMCDALSFVIMERLGFTTAIAFDRHFREYSRFQIL